MLILWFLTVSGNSWLQVPISGNYTIVCHRFTHIPISPLYLNTEHCLTFPRFDWCVGSYFAEGKLPQCHMTTSVHLHVSVLVALFLPSCYTSKVSYSSTAAAKSLQSSLTLCDPIDGSPPGSPIPGILQARTLEWVAISFSNAWKWKVKGKSLSRVRPLAWTAAYQAPPSMGFSRQEYWSRVPLPSPKRALIMF